MKIHELAMDLVAYEAEAYADTAVGWAQERHVAMAYTLRVLAFVEALADESCMSTNDHECWITLPDEPDYWCWSCRARRLMEGDAA